MDHTVFDDPTTTREEILAATYRSLRRHGYADLTIQKIGDELEQSPSLIYHHYEDKDALVLACLEYLLDHFETEIGRGTIEEPRERLEGLLDWGFGTEMSDEWQAFMQTILELRVQAIHDPAYSEHFTRSDRVFTEAIASIVRAGVDSGEFQDCEPAAVAETLQLLHFGRTLRLASTADDLEEWAADVQTEVQQYLERRLYAGERTCDTEDGHHA